MTTASPLSPVTRSRARRGRRRARWAAAAVLGAIVLAAIAAVFVWSRVSLAGDAVALARVDLQPFAGKLERARAFGPGGRPIPLTVRDGRLIPRARLAPGERISVEAVIRRPGWLGWALGDHRLERLTVRAPIARLRERWLTVPAGSPVRVQFDQPVSTVAYGNGGAALRQRTLRVPLRSLALPRSAAAGSVAIAAAARSWERLGEPVLVSWFPRARLPVAVTRPGPGTSIAPDSPLRLIFSRPVAEVLGSSRPRLAPSTPGRWSESDSHTLVFVPTGFGAPFASRLQVMFGRPLAAARPGGGLQTTSHIGWSVPAGSTLRLQQLLAEQGYLPLAWTPGGAPVARTVQAQLRAAVDPPAGRFSWRYPNTPPELRALWGEGSFNAIIRGAVMRFEDTHGLTVDALPGAHVWHALLADAVAGRRRTDGYSYVYVHSSVPQSLNLWHDGRLVLSSPGNTGIPAAPTQRGTFPVFEHIPVGTMSGTNPDGSHYHDPGIRYISYFNGGDAIHAFNRASFGTPQSLGCVELPLAAAAKVWPYTPIGTLVTVEG